MEKEGIYIVKNCWTVEDINKALTTAELSTSSEYIQDLGHTHQLTRLLRKKKYLDIVQDILETPDFHIASFELRTLTTGVDTRGYFCDWPYYNLFSEDEAFPEKSLGCQLVLAIDDLESESGGSYYIPFSHNARMFPTVSRLSAREFCDADDLVKTYPCKKKILKLKAGDAALYTNKLWVSSGFNTTSSPVRYLVANFCPLDVPRRSA